MPKKANSDILEDLYYATTRQAGLSLVRLYAYSGLLPSQILANTTTRTQLVKSHLGFNPDFISSSLEKNRTDWYQSKTEAGVLSPEYWEISASQEGLYQRVALMANLPLWAKQAQSNYSFEKLYDCLGTLTQLINFPFVHSIQVAFSVSLEQAGLNSDLDLIIQTRPFLGLPTVVISRFWLKLYLKIVGRDTHQLFWHYLERLSGHFGLNKIAQLAAEKRAKHKNGSKTKIDIGLILDSGLNQTDLHILDQVHQGMQHKMLLYKKDQINTADQLSNPILLENFKHTPAWWLPSASAAMYILSIALYPLFYLQMLWFYLLNPNDQNQVVKANLWHSFTRYGFEVHRFQQIKPLTK